MRRSTRSLGLFASLLVLLLMAPHDSAFAAGDENEGACPASTEASPGFRTYLPDCRAYELVSPPFKFGAPITLGHGGSVGASGNRVSFGSLGAFGEPGSDVETEGGNYIGTREEQGWGSTPINPAATMFQGENASTSRKGDGFEMSADLDASVFLRARVGAKPVDEHFYLQAVDGFPVEIGPLASPEAIAQWSVEDGDNRREGFFPTFATSGATGDLSHLFFTMVRPSGGEVVPWDWPGDTTAIGGPSLYEYIGTGNSEPELVGVRNQQSLAEAAEAQKKPHINEAADQISQCGVVLGSPEGSDLETTRESYNAFSANGQRVFFTALGHQGGAGSCAAASQAPEFNELYARTDQRDTTDISEPSTGPTGDCAQCDVSEPRNAYFAGASEDGSRVFFRSEQKLFAEELVKESSRGAGPPDYLYEYDFDAPAHEKVKLVAEGLAASEGFGGGVVRVSEDGTRVYFVSTAIELASNSNGLQSPQLEHDNLYVYGPDPTRPSQSEPTYVGTLGEDDEPDWFAEDGGRPVEATPDGEFLVFPSTERLTPDSSGGTRQLYRYEAPGASHSNGQLVRISVGDEGFNDDGNAAAPPSSIYSPQYPGLGNDYVSAMEAQPRAVSLSSDGSKVFFESPSALTKTALNNVCALELFETCFAAAPNIYEWSAGRIYLLSDGRDSHHLLIGPASALLGADPSGSDVFFTTADALVSQDSDTQVDLYDARVDGGLPAASVAPSCEGEGCRAPASEPPVFGAPASATFSGLGNLAPPVAKPGPELKPKPLTSAQKLGKALKACHSKRAKVKRDSCEARARKKYGAKPKVKGKKSSRRSK